MPVAARSRSYARETAIATSTLAAIAVLGTLFFGRVVFMPIVLALTLTTLFRPMVRRLGTWRIPPAVSAPGTVLAALLLVLGGLRLLEPSVRSFAGQVPTAISAAKVKLGSLPRPLNSLATAIPDLGSDSTTRGNADSTANNGLRGIPNGAPAHSQTGSGPGASSASSPSMGPFVVRLFGTAADLITDFLQTSLLLIFLLAGSDSWRQKLTGGRGHPFARALVEIGDEAQSCVSRYIAMTALINLAQGILVAIAAWALGLPSPPVWGVLTFFAEFLPYLGGIAMVALLLLVGLASSQGLGHALLGPAAYLVITTIQNNVVSPIVYGRGLELNPAAILVSVIIWLFLWGVPGAFLAVPILAIIKIVCDRIGGSLAPVSAVISG